MFVAWITTNTFLNEVGITVLKRNVRMLVTFTDKVLARSITLVKG